MYYKYKACKSITRTELLPFSLLIAFIFIGKPLVSHSKSDSLSMCFEPVFAPSCIGNQWHLELIGTLHFFKDNLFYTFFFIGIN